MAIEERAGPRPTIVTGQLLVALWRGLGEPAVADTICDRLLAGAHRFELRSASLGCTVPPGPAGR